MSRPSRTRRILKWTGVAFFILILGSWIASMWYSGCLVLPGNSAIGTESAVIIAVIADRGFNMGPPWATEIRGPMFSGLGLVRPSNEINYYPVGLRVISFPFWLLLLLTTIPTAWLWHRDRRLISSSPGHLLCIRCGYDLTGNTSGVCPECGDKVHPPAVLADSQCGEPRAAGEVKGESGQESKTNHLFT